MPVFAPITLFSKESLSFEKESGSHLLSRAVSSQVPSAAYVLTIVFGMWTGVTRKRITTGSSFVFFLENKTVKQSLLLPLERR